MARRRKPQNHHLYRGTLTREEKTIDGPEDLDLVRRPEEPFYPSGPEKSMGEVKGMKAAVLAALLLGESPEQVAAQYGLPVESIKNWQSKFDITNPIARRDQLSEHLLTFIEQEIKNLISIGIITSKEEWVGWQNAAELSAYIQVKSGAMMQLLTAFGRSSQQMTELKQKQIEMEVDTE